MPEPSAKSRRFSYLAISTVVFVILAALMMITSKQITLGGGWERLGDVMLKGLLYVGSLASMVIALLCCLAGLVEYRFQRADVNCSLGILLAAPIGYYVCFVWWPTPESLVIGASENDFLRVKRCLWFNVD